MTKHLSLKNLLATLPTIAARQNNLVQITKKSVLLLLMLATGLAAHATVQTSIQMLGVTRTVNNATMCSFAIRSIWGEDNIPSQTGSSITFSNQTIAGVTLNGKLTFQEGTSFADVITATSFTVTITKSDLWFYGATVQTKSGSNVSGCSASVSSDKHTLTVTIPTNKTFGAIIVDYVSNPPMPNNTTVSVPAGDYWVSDNNHKPKPEPTVVYGNTTLVKDTDYTLSWSSNSSAGTGTVTVTGKGNYAGTATGTFPIRWARYYVHFDKNHDDATGTMSDQQFTYNTAQNLNANTFSRTGYSLEGWSTTSNGAVTYSDGQSVTNLTAEDGQTIPLYAKWSLITYNITYDLDGGSTSSPQANPTTYDVTTPTFTLINPTKFACNFDGWTGTGLNEATQTVTIAQGSTGDRDYTANWTRSAYAITLGTDITASGTVAFTLDGTDYYAAGAEITLAYGGTVPEGQHLVFYVNDTPIANNGNTFIPTADATVSVAFHDWTGSGTESDPYIISTTAELNLLSQRVNAGTNYFNKFFKLGADITYFEYTNNYTAIGRSDNPFRGTFDGQNHSISGISISIYNFVYDNENYGLFGYVFGGTVTNVTLRNSTVIAIDNVGGIVGHLYGGAVTNCRVESTVTIGTPRDGSYNLGGIVGKSEYDATINGCFSAATVTDNNKNNCRYYGGIVGHTYNTTVSNNIVLGASIGGDDNYRGAIAGCINGTFVHNYYHGCTVGDATTNIGTPNGDITENDGAVQAFSLSLGENVTATPDPVASYNGTLYYTAGTTITLGYSGTIPSGCSVAYSVNGNAIVGNSFEMPAQDVTVTLTKQGLRYTYNSSTGALALIWGYFNSGNKWGSDVTASAVRSVTATSDVSFTGDCSELFSNFTNCTSMDLGNVNTDALSNTFCMFDKCQSLLSLEGISDWDVSNVTSMTAMFRNCLSLSSLDLSDWNTANVTNMSSMFAGSRNLTTIYVGTGWNTESVTSTSFMFEYCSSLTTIDLTGWNTSNVEDMDQMFSFCCNLQSLDLTGWNTSNVEYMNGTFRDCSGLQSLDLSGWNTGNVTDMNGMFYGCSGLQSLNLSNWNTANVTKMSSLFEDCSGLQSLDLSGWNTSNVWNMSDMFYGCSSLQSLDLTGWNTSNVEDMDQMFDGCSSLETLDLTGWNTSNVQYMNSMFDGCSSLTTIYVGEGWNTDNVYNSYYMFEDCTSLVGGMGTTYDADHTDGEYARIDRGPNSDQPGYLTGRFNKGIAGYGNSDGGYYLIASPIGTVGPENVADMLANDYDLYRFNQSAALEWENWKDDAHGNYQFDLETGRGYLYANSDDVTLSFTGTPIEDDTYDVTLTRDNNAVFAGWNLVGNPFAATAYIMGDGAFYTMNEAGTELEANTTLTSIAPMEGVFVLAEENGETLTFSTTAPSKGRGQTHEPEQIVIDLSSLTSHLSPLTSHLSPLTSHLSPSVIDRAIVRFDDGPQLPKLQLDPSHTKVYIPLDGKDYAVVSVGGRDAAHHVSTEIPLNFEAKENGEYTLTISAPLTSHLSSLTLIDNLTGADIDLLASPSYTFSARNDDPASRFKLVFKP